VDANRSSSSNTCRMDAERATRLPNVRVAGRTSGSPSGGAGAGQVSRFASGGSDVTGGPPLRSSTRERPDRLRESTLLGSIGSPFRVVSGRARCSPIDRRSLEAASASVVREALSDGRRPPARERVVAESQLDGRLVGRLERALECSFACAVSRVGARAEQRVRRAAIAIEEIARRAGALQDARGRFEAELRKILTLRRPRSGAPLQVGAPTKGVGTSGLRAREAARRLRRERRVQRGKNPRTVARLGSNAIQGVPRAIRCRVPRRGSSIFTKRRRVGGVATIRDPSTCVPSDVRNDAARCG